MSHLRTIQIAHNVVEARILNADRELLLQVQQWLSYAVKGCEQMAAFRSHAWDGRSSFFSMSTQRFPAGFVSLIYRRLTDAGYQVQVVRKPLPDPLGPKVPVFDEFGYENPDYAYQPETAELLLKFGKMIAQVATGGGKSRIAQIATARIMRPTLFLTTRSVLMYQMKGHFEKMFSGLRKNHAEDEPFLANKHKVGVLGDGNWDPRRWVNVGMVQTLISRLENEKTREETLAILARFEFVILEEAHEASGDSYYEVMNNCPNAHYRLALTATPFMKEDEQANMQLMACSGPIGIQVSEKDLIDCGILARPIFKYVKPDKPQKLYMGTAWDRAYRLGVMESVSRNKLIIMEAIRATRLGLPVMILVMRKSHGAMLQKVLQNNDIDTLFIFGDSKAKTRERALQGLASGKIQVLIGSTILDVGVDVPAIGMVILAGGGKAEVSLRQRIGRGLRSKEGSNVCLILDFMDEHNKHLMKHSLQRREIVARTPGFRENIIPMGQDFDFKELGIVPPGA